MKNQFFHKFFQNFLLKDFTYPSNSLMSLFANGVYKTIVHVTDHRSDFVMNVTSVVSLANVEWAWNSSFNLFHWEMNFDTSNLNFKWKNESLFHPNKHLTKIATAINNKLKLFPTFISLREITNKSTHEVITCLVESRLSNNYLITYR